MMNKWVKRKWLRALRSGEYEKAEGCLKRDHGYCCLGVLVAEMAPEFIVEHPHSAYQMEVDGETALLPDDLAIMWEVSYDDQQRLAQKNDYSRTFGPVIDYIEENL